eukprot:EC793147.1.p3 GENE.EC793147.1~~EC793147.1.p3  ORF type:complete len:100 (+),score=29.46 EC793147.1:149-448(+)
MTAVSTHDREAVSGDEHVTGGAVNVASVMTMNESSDDDDDDEEEEEEAGSNDGGGDGDCVMRMLSALRPCVREDRRRQDVVCFIAQVLERHAPHGKILG